MDKEIRVVDFNVKVEERAEGETKAPVIRGHAAVFNSLSEDLGGFKEIIRTGAFKRTLASDPNVIANVQHQGGLQTLGTLTNGTLRMKEDETGLAVEIDPPDTAAGRDTVELVRRGDLRKMSFRFHVFKDGDVWEDKGDHMLRTLNDVNLDGGDVSIVNSPAYLDTAVAVRALEQHQTEKGPDLEADARTRNLRLA